MTDTAQQEPAQVESAPVAEPPPKPVSFDEMRDVFAAEAHRIEGSINARRIMADPSLPVLPSQVRYVEVMETAIRLIDGIRADVPGFRAWAKDSKRGRG